MALRELITIPTMHTRFEHAGGVLQSDEDEELAGLIYQGVRSYLRVLSEERVRGALVYSDSCAVGEESDFLEYARSKFQSDHAQLIVSLVNRGGRLVGVEDPEIFQALDIHLGRRGQVNNKRDEKRNNRKVNKFVVRTTTPRDRFMARTIDETLPQNGLGILIVGANHDVGLFLPKSVNAHIPREIFFDIPNDKLKGSGYWRTVEPRLRRR